MVHGECDVCSGCTVENAQCKAWWSMPSFGVVGRAGRVAEEEAFGTKRMEAQDGRPEGLFRVPSGNVVGKPTDPGLLDVEQDPKVRCKTERFATYQERLSDLIGSCWGTYGMA